MDADGEETRTCKNDASHTETRSIPKLTHTHKLTATAAKAAACTEAGNIAYWTCSDCGKIFSDAEGTREIEQSATVIQATGHDWGDWTVTKEATVDADGEETRTCKNDASHTETRTIPKVEITKANLNLTLTFVDRSNPNITRNRWPYRGTPGTPKLIVERADASLLSRLASLFAAGDNTVTDYGMTTYSYKERTAAEYQPYSEETLEALPVGEYTLRVEIAESRNYYAASAETNFSVFKAKHDDVEIGLVKVQNNGTDLSMNLSACLEEGAVCSVSDFNGMVSGTPTVSGSMIRYSVGRGDSGTIRVAVSSRNYEDYAVIIHMTAGSSFTLDFDSKGGSAVTEERTLQAGEAYGTLPVPTRTGYTFDGWYTAPEDGTQANAATVMSGADTTLYAHWTAIPYTVTLRLNGGSLLNGTTGWTVSGDNAVKQFQIDTPDFTLPEAVRTDNYSFIGWTSGSEDAKLEVTVNQGTAQNLIYSANWLEGAINGGVEFVQADENSGVMGIQDLEQDQSDADTQKSTTMSDEYRPTSLAQAMKEIAADVASGLAAGNTNPDTKADVTVTLKTRTVQDYTLDTRPTEELTPKERTTKHEQGEILNQTSGYYDSAEQVKQDFLEISMEQTVTEKNGDEVVKTETQTVNTDGTGSRIRVVEIPLRYNLTGRYNPMVFRFHGTASALRRLATRPKDYQSLDGCFYISGRGNDAVIYIYSNKFSTWSIATSETETYTVLFDTDGGSAVNSQTIPASGTAVKPADPVRSGYDFAGWYLRNSDMEFDFSTPITEDIHLVARWTEKPRPIPIPTPAPASGSGGKSQLAVNPNAANAAKPTNPTQPTDSEQASNQTELKGRYTTDNPAPPDVTGVDQLLITETHPAYIGGFSDGTFRPDANITRAQAAAMFYRLLKNTNVARTTSFSDMTGNEWYAEAVYALSSMGIIQGYSDGSFHGNDTISRAAFAAIAARLSKAHGETGAGVTFSDVPSTYWAHDTIAQASYYGWIGGYSNGTFNPSAPITRAAVTAVINRMLGRSADRTYVSAHSGELSQFTDVRDLAAWYYYNVAEAANSHGFTVTDGNETWNSTTP